MTSNQIFIKSSASLENASKHTEDHIKVVQCTTDGHYFFKFCKGKRGTKWLRTYIVPVDKDRGHRRYFLHS